MNKTKKIELLSPAGNMDALKQAIHHGADAVYLGGSHFGARAFAGNFDSEEIQQAIHLAHLYDVKIYITVNTLIHEEHIDKFKKYIDQLVSFGADALIMQDIGMMEWVLSHYNIPVQASTQLNNTSQYNAQYLKSLGVDRVVLARESHISTIADTSQVLETEMFVHGALCICYSGQCLFSALTLGRSGNEGRCAQNCRMKYRLLESGEPINQYKYLLSPKDMCLADDIGRLITAGANSLKIEGRMKSPQYVGYVTSIYRRLIDEYYDGKKGRFSNKDTDTLARLFNRGYTKGYLDGIADDLMSVDRPNHRGIEIGRVLSTDRSRIKIRLTSPLSQGDGIKFHQSDTGFVCNKIYKDKRLVSGAAAGYIIELDNKATAKSGDILLLTKDKKLMDSLSDYEKKKIPVRIKADIEAGKSIAITIKDNNGRQAKIAHGMAEVSKNRPVTAEWVKTSLGKLGNTPYTVQDISINLGENVFIPRSVLNETRRLAVEELNNIRTAKHYKRTVDNVDNYAPKAQKPLSYSCKIENAHHYDIIKDYPFDRIYINNYSLYQQYKEDNRVYYAVDSVNCGTDYESERLLIGSTANIINTKDNEVNADYLLNVRNSASLASLYQKGIMWTTLSAEVDTDDAAAVVNGFFDKYGEYPNTEYIVYGRIQLMVTKHCAIGNNNCGKCKRHDYSLEDIGGRHYPIVADDRCCNHIYSEIIDKIKSINSLVNAHINSFRLDFVCIGDKEIINACDRVFSR